MFSVRVPLIVAAFAGLVAAGFAAVPVAAQTFTVTVTGAEISDPIPTGASGVTTVQVALEAREPILCLQDSTIPVAITVAGEAPDLGFAGDVDPSGVEFEISLGLYSQQTSNFASGEESVEFRATVGTEVPRVHPGHTYKVVATFDGSAPAGCQSPAWEESTGEGDVRITVQHPPEEPEDNGPNGENGDPANGDPEENDGQAPGMVLIVVLALLVARLRRRA